MDTALIVPVTLCLEYGIIACYVIAQIVVLFKQRHRPLHYKSIFNWLAICWMGLRTVFWALQAGQVNYNSVMENFIFWLPSCVLFLTFCTVRVAENSKRHSSVAWRLCRNTATVLGRA
jgi:hypothetical protein